MLPTCFPHSPPHSPTYIDSDRDYPERAQNIPFMQPIRNYINHLVNEVMIDITSIPGLPTSPQISQCEHTNATFDTDYTDLNKRLI